MGFCCIDAARLARFLMNVRSLAHNICHRFEHFPRWPSTLVGVAAGAGLAALFLLGVGGLPGAVGYGVLLSLALWVGFKTQPVVDVEREKTPSSALAGTPVASADGAGSAETGALLEMVTIPGGSFLMGSSRNDAEAHDSEFPQHRVTLSGFEMAKFLVTREQYRTIVGEIPTKWHYDSELDYPATHVDWFQAVAFCNALSEWEGLEPCYRIDGQSIEWRRSANGYRLPTEAEWEYAVRAGTQSIYFFGDDAAVVDRYAWYSGNSSHRVRPVGKLAANPWGLYDLVGNVWEWCWDWYGPYSAEADPDGPDEGDSRVLRGGSAWFEPRLLRSARRLRFRPELQSVFIGFRCVRGPAASL